MSELKCIILVGHGKMAAAEEEECRRQRIGILDYNPYAMHKGCDPRLLDGAVMVHFGSGNQLAEAFAFCESKKVPIIQGSTRGFQLARRRSKTVTVTAHNLCEDIIRSFEKIRVFAQRKLKSDMKIAITESHPTEKTDVSGTARAIALELGVPEHLIIKVRETGSQLILGIKKENLDGHAYHRVEIATPEDKKLFEWSRLIIGRRVYAQGAIALARAILRVDPSPGMYNVFNLPHDLKPPWK